MKMGDKKLAFSRAAWACTVCVMLLQLVGCGCMCLSDKEEGFSKDSFPLGFAFGTAGASYQYEGGAREGGRGPSIWDTFSHIPGNIKDGKNGDVAADSYHRYKEDVKLLKELGMDSYRFSISWSRILPNGTVEGGINREGIQYYNNLIDETVKHGIKPFATLFHWDLPQALEDKYKGFLDPDIVQDFKEYAEVCFMEFGDRVKHWITMNEPLSYATGGYVTGANAPGRCSKFYRNCSEGNSGVEPYIVAHHILLAHAAAVDVYRHSFQSLQKGSIGITLNTNWMVPYTNSPRDVRASLRYLDFNFGWFINPLIEGDYPVSMRALVRSRLPGFTDKQKELVKGSFDFLGINYYTANYVSHASLSSNSSQPDYYSDSYAQTSYVRNGVPIGERAASDWLYIYPQGIHDLLLYIKNRYNNPPIYITENGVDEFDVKDVPLETVLNDTTRVNYHAQHLKLVRDALGEGADVRGYFAWSLLDNFEWADGYTVRFGLYYVDFNSGTLNRYPKASVHWFQNFLKPNTHRNAW